MMRHVVTVDLLAELDRLAEETGRIPTRAMMAGQGRFDPEEYERVFGSWDQALEHAGMDPDRIDAERYDALAELDPERFVKVRELLESNGQWTVFQGQLLTELQRLAVDLGRTPSASEMTEYGRYTPHTYQGYFGSWSGAIRELGLEPNTRTGPIPEEELVAELQRLSAELGHRPRASDMNEHGRFSVPTFYDRFGSWENALTRAGV